MTHIIAGYIPSVFMDKDLPIALFDSGVGGLTVMKEVARLLPNENLIYLGDTARVPYGDRSPETIVKYTLESASFLIKRKIKLLIIACHTASSHSLEILQKNSPVPVIGMVQNGFQKLIKTTKNCKVAILGTPSTINSGIYQTLIQKKRPEIAIEAIACPLFVPLIEEGLINHPATKLIAADYLRPLKEKEIDTTLLACTHYPLIRPILQEILGPKVTLIEPAEDAALEAKQLLKNKNLLNSGENPFFHFFSTDNSDKFNRLAQMFFGSKISYIDRADLFIDNFL